MGTRKLKALSLFSGIGGLDLAAEWAGIETAAFCEIEPYAVQILKRRWPHVPVYSDVRALNGGSFAVDIVHGGFPCQDLSVAGKQAGLSGERSGLWFEMLRIISECRPRYVVAENVRGAVNLALDTVCSGLGDEGYEVRPFVIPASAVGAPHQRERLFVVGIRQDVADSFNERFQGGERGCSFLEQESPAHEPASERGEGSGSLWPTPSIAGNYNRKGVSKKSGDGLATQVAQLWPTPTVGTSGGGKIGGGSGHWAMLKAGVGIELARKMGAGLSKVNGGQLNPLWVECLMGYPIGWTDVDCDEPEPWPGWPAPMGMNQSPYEPPRTVTGCKSRAKRLKCLGNSVVPQQAYPFFNYLSIVEEILNG